MLVSLYLFNTRGSFYFTSACRRRPHYSLSKTHLGMVETARQSSSTIEASILLPSGNYPKRATSTSTRAAQKLGLSESTWPKFRVKMYLNSGTRRSPIGPGSRTPIAKGKIKWSFQIVETILSSPAIAPDGTVYVGSNDQNVYALNGSTGRKLWQYETEAGVTSSPAIGSDGTIYVGSVDHTLYALKPVTGTLRWKFHTDGEIWSSPAIGSDGTVYFGSDDNRIYALNGNTGAKQWSYLTGGAVDSSPAIAADGSICIGSNDHNVYAINGLTGTRIWAFGANFEVGLGSAAIGAGGAIFMRSSDLHLYSLDGATGKEALEISN